MPGTRGLPGPSGDPGKPGKEWEEGAGHAVCVCVYTFLSPFSSRSSSGKCWLEPGIMAVGPDSPVTTGNSGKKNNTKSKEF